MPTTDSKLDLSALRNQLAPTPLSTFLGLYCKANHECYIEYMFGAKELAKWLHPVEIPYFPPLSSTWKLLNNYETGQLASILYTQGCRVAGYTDNWLVQRRAIESAIVNTLVNM